MVKRSRGCSGHDRSGACTDGGEGAWRPRCALGSYPRILPRAATSRLTRAHALAPGIHHKGVVDRHAGDGVHPLAAQLVGLLNEAGQVLQAAGGREGAGHRKQHHLRGAVARAPAAGVVQRRQSARGRLRSAMLPMLGAQVLDLTVAALPCHTDSMSISTTYSNAACAPVGRRLPLLSALAPRGICRHRRQQRWAAHLLALGERAHRHLLHVVLRVKVVELHIRGQLQAKGRLGRGQGGVEARRQTTALVGRQQGTVALLRMCLPCHRQPEPRS